MTPFGPFYTCDACGCRAALRRAIRAEDWQTVKFLAEFSPREHAADCDAPRGPMFEVIT